MKRYHVECAGKYNWDIDADILDITHGGVAVFLTGGERTYVLKEYDTIEIKEEDDKKEREIYPDTYDKKGEIMKTVIHTMLVITSPIWVFPWMIFTVVKSVMDLVWEVSTEFVNKWGLK